jgi:hypothetical protein
VGNLAGIAVGREIASQCLGAGDSRPEVSQVVEVTAQLDETLDQIGHCRSARREGGELEGSQAPEEGLEVGGAELDVALVDVVGLGIVTAKGDAFVDDSPAEQRRTSLSTTRSTSLRWRWAIRSAVSWRRRSKRLARSG